MVHKRGEEIATPKGEWMTPNNLYDLLDAEFHFDADAAATVKNAKHPVFFTKSMNALKMNWREVVGWKPPEPVDFDPYCTQKRDPAFFLNPSYERGIVDQFVHKARMEARQHSCTVVCLLSLAAETEWWQREVMGYDRETDTYSIGAQEIRFIYGRIKYIGYTKDGKQITQSPFFTSCIVIFCGEHPCYWNQDRKPLLPILGKTIVLRD